jgi:surface protein
MQTKYLNYGSAYLYALHGSGEQHIKKWIRERIMYCDTLLGYMTSSSDYITLRSSKLGYVYLDIQTYIPMYLRVKWRDEANNTGMQVKRIGRGETVRFEYNMPTATDQEIVVYGGHYLKSLGDVSNLEPTTMLIANADRLTEIECHSNNLINTDLSVCTKLQRIDISNSPALGTGVGAQPTLNIQNCKYLRYCNCYNTSLTAIYTMQSGGNLEELYYPATTQVVQISNQKHLKRVGLPSDISKDEYCRSLQTVQITNCNAIQTLHYPFHENDEIDFSPFKYVQDLSITNSIDRLVFMSFSGFNKLKTLTLQSLKNLGGVGFDDMLGINDVSAFQSIVIADTPQIPQVSFNVSDPERYKIAFADNAVIDLSAMFGVNTITSNAERLQGLKRILVPTTIKNINFPVDNGIKSIITGTSEHIADLDWEGYDLPGAVLETCDLSGVKITHAESLSLAPINEIPVINKNKTPIEFVVPKKGTYDLTNYVGSTLDNSFKGFDLSEEYNIKCDAALDKITSISSVFKNCKVDALKINNLLERLPNLASMESTFANCTNLENPKLLNIPAKVNNFKQCFEGSDVKQDIAFKENVIDVRSAFKNCNSLEDVTTNWKTEYIDNVLTEDCYAECNHITKFNGEDLFLTEYELGRDRIPVKWGGNDFQNENTAVYEVVTDAVNVKLVFPNRKCLLDNGRVDWGDGTITEGVLTHTYAQPGTYIIKGKLLIGDGEVNPSETIRRCLTKIHKVPNIPINYTNMFSDCRNLEYVDFTCGIPTNLTKTFIANTKLKTIKFGDLSQCAIFNNTFAECVELETIENFKVHSVCEDLSYVFNGCAKLKSLPNMNLWDTSNIKSLEATFYGCGITDFTQVENWDLTSCTSIYAVFARTNVKKINLSGWQINNSEESDLIFSLRDLFYHCEALQEVNVSNIVTNHVNNIDNMFYNCISLKTIIGLTTWDTSNVGSMHGVFYSVPIDYFDFSGWDFSKLNIAPNNLWGTTPEKTIVLNNIAWAYPKQINNFLYSSSNYGKSKVTEIVMDEIREDMTDFSGMFKNCSELYTDIAFPTWATSVFECFKNCVGMKEIRSNWNTEYDNLTEENHLDCYAGVNIEKIDGVKDRVTSIPENWGGLAFRLDDTLEVEIDTLLIESLNVTFTVDSYGAVLWGDGRSDDLTVANSLSSGTYVCTHTYNAHGVYTVKLKRPKLSYREGASVSKITSIPSDYVCDSTASGIRNKFTNNDNVGLTNATSINISNLANAKEKITTCAKAFYKMESLTEIIGLDQLDYSEVTSMASMFEGCKALTTVSMRNWDTTNVVNRENMFTGCQSLVFINVTDMILGANLSSLFHGASTVTVIMGLTDLQPENVTDLSKAFYDCSYLSFDTIFEFLSKIDTSKVQSMSKLFNNVVLTAEQVEQICNTFTKIPSVDILGCQPRLESLDLLLPIFEKADWSRPLDFSDLFAGWAKLKDVKALANYSTSTVYKANGLFRGCYELEDISGLRNWDTKGITDMSYMFYECKKLADLTPLREWNVSNVTNMSYMFSVEGESLIKTLDGLEKWNVSAVTNMKAMFYAVGGYGYNDYSCKDISAIAGWNVIGVKDMSYMFGGFRISDYSLFNGWNIQSLQQAAFMFAHHWNVPSDAERTIDLSAWDVTNVSFGYAGIFYNCGWLQSFTSFKNINDSMFYIDDCVRLTVDSLMSIINNLKKTFSVKKLYIGEANMEKLTDEQLAVAIEKGWTVQ